MLICYFQLTGYSNINSPLGNFAGLCFVFDAMVFCAIKTQLTGLQAELFY